MNIPFRMEVGGNSRKKDMREGFLKKVGRKLAS